MRSRSGGHRSYRRLDLSWISAYAPRYDVTLSLVSVLGAVGVQQMHEPAMTTHERAAL
jgi:hypothetical protein